MSKSELAYDFLRDRIVTTRIPPDTPLRIQTLGRDSGFGSTPVREALFRLEAEKLVVSEVNCGFKSAPISIEKVKDLEHSRLVIETALLRDAIETGADDWEGRIVATHYQLAKLTLPVDTEDAGDHRNWAIKHKNFHAALPPDQTGSVRSITNCLNSLTATTTTRLKDPCAAAFRKMKRSRRNFALSSALITTQHLWMRRWPVICRKPLSCWKNM